MKILIISDSHGNTDNLLKAVKKNSDADLLIHLGDYIRDLDVICKNFPQLEIEAVTGNNDFFFNAGFDSRISSFNQSEKVLMLDGKKVFITHGHKYSVKRGYEQLCEKALQLEADLVLFGHTHIPELINYDGFSILNPGSVGFAYTSSGETFCIAEITDGKINFSFENMNSYIDKDDFRGYN